jgi:hypothetical protein
MSAAAAGSAEGPFLGAAPSASAQVTGNAARLDEMDYRWTQEAPTEIFFIVLTAVVFPYAAWRLLRRLRGLAEACASAKAGPQNP